MHDLRDLCEERPEKPQMPQVSERVTNEDPCKLTLRGLTSTGTKAQRDSSNALECG